MLSRQAKLFSAKDRKKCLLLSLVELFADIKAKNPAKL